MKKKCKGAKDIQELKEKEGISGMLCSFVDSFWDFTLELEDFLYFLGIRTYGCCCWDSVFSFMGLWIRGLFDGVKPSKGQDCGRSFFSGFYDRDR
jgi:hypothetical protein